MPTRSQTYPALVSFRGTAAVATLPRPTDGCKGWARDWATSPIPGRRPEFELAA